MNCFRTFLRRSTIVLLALLALPLLHADVSPDWTTPLKPFRIAGNLYYVGSRDLASYLIVTPKGNILINGNLATSPPQIRASVEQLGFKWTDTRILLNSQAHYDHAAGNAQIVKETHARVMVMDGDVSVIQDGDKNEWDSAVDVTPFAPVHVNRTLHDGDTVALGGVVLTAHKTAGHTRGCTAWSMQVKGADGKLLNVVIVGGFAPLSYYKFLDTAKYHASYPGIEHDFEQGYATQLKLPCDIFLGAHGQYFDLLAKFARMPQEGESVWIDPAGYRKAVLDAQAAFNKRLEAERAANR
jgi:metallo-beta-lactamase class B